MPRFAANLTFLFNEVSFLDRFELAADAGFRAVEFMFPYEFDARAIVAAARQLGLEIVLFNLPVPEFAQGGRGIAVLPDRSGEFRSGVMTALQTATTLGTKKLNGLVGHRSKSVPWAEQYSCLVDNLRWATDRAAERGVTLLVEQLNPIDNPGYFLDSLPLVEQLLADVASDRLKLQFDVYHVQRTHGNVIENIRRLAPVIEHVQIADSPDRNEPGTGEIAFERVLTALDECGYSGYVGLEYRPSRTTVESFGWVTANGWKIGG